MKVDGNGKRYNSGKVSFTAIPPQVLVALGKHLTINEIKYPNVDGGTQPNWSQGFGYMQLYDGLMRHLLAWLSGESHDPESGSHHLTAVIWAAMVLLFFELNPTLYAIFDDRWTKELPINTAISNTEIDHIKKSVKKPVMVAETDTIKTVLLK